MGKITEPVPITENHDVVNFDCGNPKMNDWLKERALANQGRFSITRVVCANEKVIAYYTLSLGSVNRADMARKIKANAPDKIPVMILGRLAVDLNWQGKGIAKHLLKESMLKTIETSHIAGTRGLLVQAIDEIAKEFYLQYEFLETKVDLTLFLPLEDIKAQL